VIGVCPPGRNWPSSARVIEGDPREGVPMLYRITIKRGTAMITTLTLQTDDPDEAVELARLDFDLQKRQRNATAVILTDQDGRVVYSYPWPEPA
jgi:hypothetical protein